MAQRSFDNPIEDQDRKGVHCVILVGGVALFLLDECRDFSDWDCSEVSKSLKMRKEVMV